jgi:(2Fe-2S) ferredoxin
MTGPGSADNDPGPTVLLLARSAVSAVPIREMERFCAEVAGLPGVTRAMFAFSEQGKPSLREVLDQLVAAVCSRILIVPLLLPAEPNFATWLSRTLQRWQAADVRPWPQIRVAPLLADHPAIAGVLSAMVQSGGDLVATGAKPNVEAQASIVPAQKRCVLVCLGGPCHAAGAAVIWGHLRNEQERLSLRTAGDGTFTARTSCLGPCALAPVVQVWPEGIHYGGVTEGGIDRIIQVHLLGGAMVEDLAYRPNGRKQALRS